MEAIWPTEIEWYLIAAVSVVCFVGTYLPGWGDRLASHIFKKDRPTQNKL